ncbi:kinase-like domain-containing protein [Rhizophagus clarus]|uniref:Kinase-like domain-containing protein n=1 Tax=Rhizophagus clarus TaxID=94130 RepID=A0A8H3R0L5_9GLOM|nr:kinase-like domain-containing protein [Rhizophagus clarus]
MHGIHNICSDCKIVSFKCQNCISKILQQDWTSGNKYIDKFIRESQLEESGVFSNFIEWISYNRLRNIKYLAHGGFSIIYKAIWLDGYIKNFQGNNVQRYRNELNNEDYEIANEKDVKLPLNENEVKGLHVALKSLNNSSNINAKKYYVKNHLKCSKLNIGSIIRIFGITQDPETSNYMLVMEFVNGGNLRSNLLIKKYNPFEKYLNLMYITRALLTLHECNLFHGDFHSGNILLDHTDSNYLSDFGLSRPVNKIVNSNEIYGVIPYMAPEILRGKPYTKAADIYSFGIIMWEFTSGVPAFHDKPHDLDLSLDICKGLRPEIVESTLPVYARLMKRCWNSDPNKRPTADELFEILSCWFAYCPKTMFFDRIPVPSDEKIIENHLLSCYMNRKIDYSAKINETLTQEELSSKFMIGEKNEINNEPILLSESLGKIKF